MSRQSSAITQADPRCTYGFAPLYRTLARLLNDTRNKLDDTLDELRSDAPEELVSALDPIPDRIYPDQLQSSGYVVHTIQASLYHGLTADSTEKAIVSAVNMGNDTDTVGAVTGAITGARFGASALPDRWWSELSHHEEIVSLADELAALQA